MSVWGKIFKGTQVAGVATGVATAVAGTVVAADVAMGTGATRWLGTRLATTLGFIQSETGVRTRFNGFYSFFEEFAKMLQSFFGAGPGTQGMMNWAQRMQGKTETGPSSTASRTGFTGTTPGGPTPPGTGGGGTDPGADSGFSPTGALLGGAVLGGGAYAATRGRSIIPSITPTATPGSGSPIPTGRSGLRRAAIIGGLAAAGAVAAGTAFGEEAPASTTDNAPATPASGAQPTGLLAQGASFARGLVNDATDTNNWTAGNALNLGHAAAHGGVRGIGNVLSFAFANTVGWATGHTTNDINRDYVGAAIDGTFRHTVGLPDLSGHWATAVNNVAEFAAPAAASAGIAAKVATAFRWATTGTELVAQTGRVRMGTQLAMDIAGP